MNGLPTKARIVAKFVIAALCIAIATLPGLFVAHYGAQPFDEPYQMLNALDYRNTAFAPLSNYFGYLFGSHVGFEWMNFRYLALAFYWVSILMGCVYMWCKTRQYKMFLFFSSVLVLIAGLLRVCQVVYGWDTWTMPITVLTIILTFEYHDHKKQWMVVAFGLLSATIAMLRLPSIVVVPIFCFVLYLCNEKGKRLMPIAIYIATTTIALTALIYALYGTLTEFVQCLLSTKIDEHSPVMFLWTYINGAARIAPLVSTILMGYYIYMKVLRKWIVALVMVYIIAYTMYYRATYYSSNVLDMELTIVAIMYGLAYYYNPASDDHKKVYAFALLSIVPLIGSNTGFYKFVLLPSIPILAIYLHKHISRSVKQIGLIVLAGFLVYSIIGVCQFSYLDAGILEAKYEFKDGLAKGIKTTPAAGEYIDSVMTDMKPYASGKTLVLRRINEYIFEYLLQSRNDYLRHRFEGVDYNDKEYIDWVRNEIDSSKEPLTILYFDEPTAMSDMLEERCSKVLAHDDYVIYQKLLD
jgi:hypothetical protein